MKDPHFSIGCDIVKISRIEKFMGSSDTLQKVFHTSEMRQFSPQHLAGIFAAKEATIKALGLTTKNWLDMEVIDDEKGKPTVSILNHKEKIDIEISISHEEDYAFAVAIAIK